MSICPARIAARTMLVGPSWIRRSTGWPWASITSAIMLPSSAPSVSIFEPTTIAPAASARFTGERTRRSDPVRRTMSRSLAIGGTRCPQSQRDCEQGVDPSAVEDDDLAVEPPPRGIVHDAIEIAPGGEQRHLAVLHRTDNEEIGDDLERIAGVAIDLHAGDQVAV